MKVGDIVKAYVQVQSNAAMGVVGKLSYKAKGPFIISADLGKNSYEVKHYDNPSSTTRKYKGTELYLLPPALFPSAPLETINQRYLNSQYGPIVNPLLNPLRSIYITINGCKVKPTLLPLHQLSLINHQTKST